MIRLKPLTLQLFCLAGSLMAAPVAHAQSPDGGAEDFGSRMLRRLDRDENGVLDPEELERFGPLRDYLERQNVDVDSPVPLGVVADHQAGMMEEMQAQRGGGEGSVGFGGRGGFGRRGGGGPEGFGGGGPPSDSPQGEGRSRGDRGGRGERSRGGGRGGDVGRSDGSGNAGSGDERRGSRMGRRGETAPGSNGASPGSQPPGKPGTKPKVRVGRVGPKPALPPATLPAQYASRDINQDGQIGLYEWSRTDFSTFQRLDTNRDGFLTPAELVNPAPAGSATATATTVSTGTGYIATPATRAVAATSPVPKAAPGAAQPTAASAPPGDLKTVAAESAFDFLDQEKDGKLSEEEWQRSRNARKMFADAKVEIQMPLTKAKFVEHYIKLSK